MNKTNFTVNQFDIRSTVDNVYLTLPISAVGQHDSPFDEYSTTPPYLWQCEGRFIQISFKFQVVACNKRQRLFSHQTAYYSFVTYMVVNLSISYQCRSERGDELGEVNIKIMIDDHHFGNFWKRQFINARCLRGCRLQITATARIMHHLEFGDRSTVVIADGMSDSEHHRCPTYVSTV